MMRETSAGATMLERLVADLVDTVNGRYHGKYPGEVVRNDDPLRLGRLKLKVPTVFGPDAVTGWAQPCVPYGGAANEGFLSIPAPKAKVWVEFAAGNWHSPIWVGSYWVAPEGGGSQAPVASNPDGTPAGGEDPSAVKIIRTATGHTLQFDETAGAESLLIRVGVHGHHIVLNGDGVTIVDARKNVVVLASDGIKLTDRTGNTVAMSRDAFTITAKVPLAIDAPGQPVTITADTIDLRKG